MFESLLNAFRAPDIRRRILFVAGILVVFRFLAHVPVPGVDRVQLAAFFNGSPLFGLLDLFSGGGLSTFSIVGLGMNPYILGPGERCASTSNRNFEGRQGRGGRTHLVSPAMAAAAAIAGHFVDVREWETVPG